MFLFLGQSLFNLQDRDAFFKDLPRLGYQPLSLFMHRIQRKSLPECIISWPLESHLPLWPFFLLHFQLFPQDIMAPSGLQVNRTLDIQSQEFKMATRTDRGKKSYLQWVFLPWFIWLFRWKRRHKSRSSFST